MYKLIFFGIIILAISCKKNEIQQPDFGVSTQSVTYKTGDSVKFLLSGYADNLTFYSGETGHNYDYRDRTIAEGNKLVVKFNTYIQFLVGGKVDLPIKFLVSTDFNGTYDTTNIKAATWTDLSSKAVFSTGADQTPSGEIDLTDYIMAGKQILLAFQCKNTTIIPGNRWVIRSIVLSRKSVDNVYTTIFDMGTAGWKSASFANPANVWTISTPQLLFAASTTTFDNDWVITAAVDKSRVNSVSPDYGVVLKDLRKPMLQEYSYRFTTPGTYKVVFVGTNANYNGVLTSAKEISVTVTPKM